MWRLARVGWSKTRRLTNFEYAAEIYFAGRIINEVESFEWLHNLNVPARSLRLCSGAYNHC